MVAAWGMATTLSQRRSVCRPAGPWVSVAPPLHLPLRPPALSFRQTTCPLNRELREDAPVVEFQGKFPEVIGIAHLGMGDPRHVCLLVVPFLNL